MARKHYLVTRLRQTRSRPRTPAPKTGWVISELSRITGLPVRRIRYYVEHALIRPAEIRGTATRYQRSELLGAHHALGVPVGQETTAVQLGAAGGRHPRSGGLGLHQVRKGLVLLPQGARAVRASATARWAVPEPPMSWAPPSGRPGPGYPWQGGTPPRSSSSTPAPHSPRTAGPSTSSTTSTHAPARTGSASANAAPQTSEPTR